MTTETTKVRRPKTEADVFWDMVSIFIVVSVVLGVVGGFLMVKADVDSGFYECRSDSSKCQPESK